MFFFLAGHGSAVSHDANQPPGRQFKIPELQTRLQ